MCRHDQGAASAQGSHCGVWVQKCLGLGPELRGPGLLRIAAKASPSITRAVAGQQRLP